MKLKLRKLSKLSGEKASTYTVYLAEEGITVFDKFLTKLLKTHEQNLLNLLRRMKSIANVVGATENFYRPDEGLKIDDGVIAINEDPDELLRLYGVRLSDKLVVVGGGGPKKTRTWQEDSNLKNEVELMMLVSQLINHNRSIGKLWISEDGLDFCGNLDLN